MQFPLNNKRTKALSICFLIFFFVLILRLAQLCLWEGDSLRTLAESQRNRSFDYYQYARGDLYDCKMRLLTDTIQTSVIVLPTIGEEAKAQVAESLAAIFSCDEATVTQRLELGSAQSLAPFVLRTGLDAATAHAIREADLPGVMVVNLPARYSGLATHVIGYVQPVGEDGAYVGVSGLEAQYDSLLRDREDTQVQIEVDASGALSEDTLFLEEAKTVSHTDLQLTLDRDYQQIAEQAFEDLGYAGACVIMDPNTGDILALVSAPDYDPYGWEKASGDCYVDKALALYPPASTFKTLLALAALNEKSALPTGELTGSAALMEALSDTGEEEEPAKGAVCVGNYLLANGHSISCAVAGGHGEVDLASALARSCNSYFVALGQILGGDTIQSYAQRFGLTSLSVIGYDTPNYEQEDFLAFSSSLEGDVANLSLGESVIRISVIQQAVLTSICVNGGFRVWPRLVCARL